MGKFPQPQLGSPNNLAGECPMCCRQGHIEGSQEVLPGDSVQTVWPQNFLGLMVKSQIFPSNQLYWTEGPHAFGDYASEGADKSCCQKGQPSET